MNFLFVHKNFPAQFRHVAKALVDQGHTVVGLCDVNNLKNRPPFHPTIPVFGYQPHGKGQMRTHHYVRDFENAIRRGQSVVRALMQLQAKGFHPDVVVAHPGWGEALFLRDIFPLAKHVYYCEYYYSGSGGDIGCDPEFAATLDDQLRARIKNSTQLVSLVAMDEGISPTRWQAGRYPVEFQSKIQVLHEGIDTDVIRPDPDAVFQHGDLRLTRHDEVVTYVARNLEPYRGFHVFMRSLSKVLAMRPNAKIIIVGGDDVSYGKKLPEGQTYRELYCAEIKNDVDWSRVYFTGKLSYSDYLKLLQISSVHVYLTYPFVLSWSMLESMAAGCVLVASATPPVQEIIEDGKNGKLVEFLDPMKLADSISEVLAMPEHFAPMRLCARETIVKHYDLKQQCLPAMVSYLTNVRSYKHLKPEQIQTR